MRPSDEVSGGAPVLPARQPGARQAARRAGGHQRGRRLWVGLGAAVVLLAALVLGLGQLVLPGIAANRVRDAVARYGAVHRVTVSATPAVELLWEEADRIAVGAGALRISPAGLVGLEQRLRGVGRAELQAGSLEVLLSSLARGGVRLQDARLAKAGRSLTAQGYVRSADLHLALPAGLQVTGLESTEGAPEVVVAGGLAGVRLEGRAEISAQEGDIVVRPVGIPLAGLATLTLFADPRLAVESVTATPSGEGFAVTVTARQTG